MEEKIIINNEYYNKDQYMKIAKNISIVLLIVLLVIELFNGMLFWPFEDLIDITHYEYVENRVDIDIPAFIESAWYAYILCLVLPTVSLYLVLKFAYVIYSKEEIVLTDKRVYGKTIFGVHIDLPIQSISGVSEVKVFRGVSVSTSSKSIKFVFVKNASEIRQEISSLLMTRVAENPKEDISNNNKETVSSVDELKKFKELLDIGAITQEEFDAKKKQLLGL